MKIDRLIIYSLILTALIVFLFVTAPPPLHYATETQNATINIKQVFKILDAENSVARSIWTNKIVKPGKQAGLKFSEDWRLNSVKAGPLPALFLRETARNMEKNPLRLSLFLGSDFPINSANKFDAIQFKRFRLLKSTSKPQFFQQQDMDLYVAMFPDKAISTACVDCHNNHNDSPKTDWKINDIMGATTWMYTDAKISMEQCLELLKLLRESIKTTYTLYIEKVSTFQKPPEIGEKWPEQGYYLPDVDRFIARIVAKASANTVSSLLEHSNSEDVMEVKQ